MGDDFLAWRGKGAIKRDRDGLREILGRRFENQHGRPLLGLLTKEELRVVYRDLEEDCGDDEDLPLVRLVSGHVSALVIIGAKAARNNSRRPLAAAIGERAYSIIREHNTVSCLKIDVARRLSQVGIRHLSREGSR